MSTHNFRYGIFWLCALTIAGAIVPRAFAQVVISEVMWMGSDISSADEWIEIWSQNQIDLSGWTISYLKNDQEVEMIKFGTGMIINNDDFKIVSNYGSDKSRLLDEPMLVDSSVSLPNSKLKIFLRNSSGVLIDTVDDGSGAPFAGKNPSGGVGKASMERIDLLDLGNDSANWRSAEISKGFDEGVEIWGSPGFENSTKTIQEQPFVAAEEDKNNEVSSGSVISIPRIYISEILPNPEGKDDDEWIEIVNAENYPVDLSGWKIKRSGDEYVIKDYEIASGGIVVFNKSETEMSFKNSGDTIQLLSGSLVIDSITYPTAKEEVSFGRKIGEPDSFASFCVPTKGGKNLVRKLYPRIRVESGKTKAESKTSVNFKAEVDHGSLRSATCMWDFDDESTSFKCNPPSHTFNEPKVYAVTLSVETVCGGFEEATEYVEVVEVVEELNEQSTINNQQSTGSLLVKPEHPFVGAGQNNKNEIKCIPTSSTGITISEILPAPSSGEEWIKLVNLTDQDFNLCGWVLDDVRDGGSKPWTIQDEIISANDSIIFTKSQTRLSLNNSGDEVWLISPDGEIELNMKYARAKKDQIISNELNASDLAQPIPAPGTSYPGGYRKPDGLDGVVKDRIITKQSDSDEPKILSGLNIVEDLEYQERFEEVDNMFLEIIIISMGVITSVGLVGIKFLRG